MSFSSDMDKIIQKARVNADTVVRKVTFDLAKSIINESPVDTGRFRANWQFGEDSLPTGIIDATDKPGKVTLAKIETQAITSKAGGVNYIANNLPYALRLEYGHSKQAPSGMLRITMSRYQKYIRDAAAQL
ncbi:MAG TPA: hypothetical protein DIS96_03740 [Pusillimonas sp.]|nr:hypothetical protein [Pusillimonas sp.]